MDEELFREDLDRTFKVPTLEEGDDDEGIDIKQKDIPFDDPTAIQSNVLSNLLESLEAQDGNPGPASTILKEMGVKAPGEIE